MGRDGKPTRDNILVKSRALVLKNGFSGTRIDQILEETGITKGAFFYHFKTKNDLAKALIEEFAEEDLSHLESALKKTESLGGDALDRLLHFIQLFIDQMTNLKGPPEGCLYASYTYEPNQFSQEILDKISETLLIWRNSIENLLQNVLEEYDVKGDLDLQSLADHMTVIFEGGFIVSKALKEPDITARQLMLLKQYFELLFEKKG